jgi:hypothetical protein
VALERGERGGHRRHEAEAHADAAQPIAKPSSGGRWCGADQPERDRHDRGQDHADQRDRAATVALGQLAGERHPIAIPRPCGAVKQTGVDHAVVTQVLPVQRHQDHRAEHGGAEREHHDRGGREVPARYSFRSSSGRLARSAWNTNSVTSRTAAGDRAVDPRGAERAERADLGQAVGDRHQAARHQAEARARQGGPSSRRCRRAGSGPRR